MADPAHKLLSFKSEIDDGKEITFIFRRADGTEHRIALPFNDVADFIVGLETQARDMLAQLNASLGVDRRHVMPVKMRRVTKLQGAIAQDGRPVLSLELDGRLPLDLALEREDIPDMVEWFETLQSQARTNPWH